MKAIVTKVSPKNPKQVQIEVIDGDFVVAKGWTKLGVEKVEGEEVECPKGYLPVQEEGKNEAQQTFYKIVWVAK